mmetsp:Transcript_1315/g.1176  ORF Transcript_1315/g.1176 Transcript_1315/m.1176 type:complete len:196 (-) Transcript_1315:19-606(-)
MNKLSASNLFSASTKYTNKRNSLSSPRKRKEKMKMSEFCKIQRVQYISKLMKKPVDRVKRYPPVEVNFAYYNLPFAAHMVQKKRNIASARTSRVTKKFKRRKGRRSSLVLTYPEKLARIEQERKSIIRIPYSKINLKEPLKVKKIRINPKAVKASPRFEIFDNVKLQTARVFRETLIEDKDLLTINKLIPSRNIR